MAENNRKTLSVYPDITDIQYSDPISTEVLNKQFESLNESVLRSLIRTQEINTSLATIESALNVQAIALAQYYSELDYKDTNVAYITAFDKNHTGNNMSYDTAYGYYTLGLNSSYSKIPRNEKYNGKVSPQVRIFINDEEQTIDSAAFRALDGSLNTLWFDQYGEGAEVKFEIQLPPSLTKRFNYIQLDPFPTFGFNLNKVEYQDNFGAYHDVLKDTFGSDDVFGYDAVSNISTNKAFPTKIYVSPKEFNGKIIVYGTTSSVGSFGFSNIDIAFMDFNDTSAESYLEFTEFSVDLGDTRNVKLNSAAIDYYFDSPNASDLLSGTNPPLSASLVVGSFVGGTFVQENEGIDLDLVKAATRTIDINTEITLNPGQTLFLKLTLKEHNLTTPVFRGCKLNFQKL